MQAQRPWVPSDPKAMIDEIFQSDRRVLLVGAPGTGKSTLVEALSSAMVAAGRRCQCIFADPGSPAFGLPGSIGLAERGPEDWVEIAAEPVCTLDAGRFRLPVVSAVARLAVRVSAKNLLIDSPGVVRGVAGRELLHGLAAAAGADAILVVTPAARELPMAQEIASMAQELFVVPGPVDARRPGRRERARLRTRSWDTYLAAGSAREFRLEELKVTGTPPPADVPFAWTGRQIALLRAGRLAAMGEVLALAQGRLTVLAPTTSFPPDALLIRDATRSSEGMLETARPHSEGRLSYLPPPNLLPDAPIDPGPRPVGRVGMIDTALVNGLFGDPLLHARIRHQASSLLFDLGEGRRLSARIAHQVSAVFISHAHMDHLSGFAWLLRSRIGETGPCLLFGPPGLAGHIRGLVDGFLWDRIGPRGPMFTVGELHGNRLLHYQVKAGEAGIRDLGTIPAPDGVIHRGSGYLVRAVTLDHGTPVLAFALEPESDLNVRKDRLRSTGLRPGPWLGELKQQLRSGAADASVRLPDGRSACVRELARDLILIRPGKRLVYATDLADTPGNRERLIGLARRAHTLFLEASFVEADARHALANGHLTARACGEIAEAAGVSRLVPFHLSRRYAEDPWALFEEVRTTCPRVLLPPRPEVTGPHLRAEHATER